MSERPSVLQIGPDPELGGGMAAAMRGLLGSPLADRYRLEVVATYRDPRPLRRLAVFLAGLARLTSWSLRGRGHIVHVHATVRGSAYRKAVCVLWAKAMRRQVVLHIHSGAGDIATFRDSRGPLSLALIRAALRAADAVLAVSAASAEALRTAGVEERIDVVPNAAPLVPPLERPDRPDGEVAVLYLGGFANPAKGGDVLVEALPLALRLAPQLRMTLAGPGEPTPQDAARIGAAEGVEWVGWLDGAGKDAALRAATVFVMPSRSEGLPMALMEAMAYGLPVVASRVGGIPEVLDDGVEGLLVPVEQPAALAEALCRLAGDGELRRAMGAAARGRIERIDDDEVAGGLIRIYARISPE